MSAAVHIRFVTRGDYAEWLPLWEGYNRFYGRFGATALADAITEVTWARFFDAYEPMFAMVAEVDQAAGGAGPLFVASQHDLDRADVLSAGPVHRRGGAGQGCGTRPDRGGLRAGPAGGCGERLLADACYECDGSAAVRPGGGGVRFAGVQEAACLAGTTRGGAAGSREWR